VFFPAFNDARSLPDLLARTFAVLRTHVADYEVIVINDGSTDDTAAVLEELRRLYDPFLKVVTHPCNQGYGAALRSGFAHASKEFVFYTDGDGQYDPSELVALLAAVTAQTGLVNGYKMERQDPWHRIAIGWLYNQFARRLFRIRVRDIDCDFRLIRRSILQDIGLTSTSGTICVELVRRLEMSGAKVVEVPVHHYPRLHGRSQFFRIRSLATTFIQLWLLFSRLVLLRSAAATAGIVCLGIAALSMLAYARSVWLPFISDDYIQIGLGRDYGPVSGWGSLLRDALYRCRTTSILFTYWTERWFGTDPLPFNVSSLAIHILNSMLVFALGMWRPIGWKVSAVAAGVFAILQCHQEAVIWYAALPELLVFFFGVLSFLGWICWLQSEPKNRKAYGCAFFCFLLALASKESAVVVPPLMLLAATLERHRRRGALLSVAPFATVSLIYFGMILAASKTHVHFHDAGTFSLSAPFPIVLLRSSLRMIWFWGAVSLVALAVWRARHWTRLLSIAAAWSAVTFLPYCFLTYMPYVPSRHTYLASVGLALVIAAALLEVQKRTAAAYGYRLAAVLAAALVAQQCTYLWTKKQTQFAIRAWPTEKVLQLASQARSPVYVKCFPYPKIVMDMALRVRLPEAGPDAVVFGSRGGGDEGLDLCTEPAR